MRDVWRWMTLAAAMAWWAGCADKAGGPDREQSTSAPASAAPTAVTNASEPPSRIPGWPPTKAQPKLPTMKLFIGPEVVVSELAVTAVQVGTGMMFRKEMAENEGMLFVFAQPQRVAFYMRNTYVPLTVAYIDREGTILELHDLKPLDETPVEAASDKVQFVLEMNQGWFKRHNIAPGTVITTEVGKLREAFQFGR